MTDTLPWIIAGACALWAIVATIIWRMDAAIKKAALEDVIETVHHVVSERDQLRARIEAARKALEEEG